MKITQVYSWVTLNEDSLKSQEANHEEDYKHNPRTFGLIRN